jgi:hypothetical protein
MDLKQSIAGINHKYWGFMLFFVANTQHFPLTLGDFSENSSFLPKNSRIFAQNSRIFLKNSRFRKFQELEMPEKASKKSLR